VIPYKGQKDVYTLSGLDDIIAPLEESLVSINTIMGSRFVEPIREEVAEWNGKLMLLQETLDEWMTCQRSWMYLESIFTAQDIVRQLPEESSTFAKVLHIYHGFFLLVLIIWDSLFYCLYHRWTRVGRIL
jgi:dynein heavy chain